MGWWVSFFLMSFDTLLYDDGTAEGFYVVGEYEEDKIGVNFTPKWRHYLLHGIMVFAQGKGDFSGEILKGKTLEEGEILIQLDTIYSKTQKWATTLLEGEVLDSENVWVILHMKEVPAIGGDHSRENKGNSWYYSAKEKKWKETKFNWMIRLIVEGVAGYSETFEVRPPSYTGNWEFGEPKLVSPISGNCFGVDIDSMYKNNWFYYLETGWLKLNLISPILIFSHNYNTQLEYDGGNVKVSNDNNNWVLLYPVEGYDIQLKGANKLDGELGFSGKSEGWEEVHFLLPPWDSVKIRWEFGSDEIGNREGWFIDNVRIQERRFHDVGIVEVSVEEVVFPISEEEIKVKIKNLGIYEESFWIKAEIENERDIVYQDSTFTTLLPTEAKEVELRKWRTGEMGEEYELNVELTLGEDENLSNNRVRRKILLFKTQDSVKSGVGESIVVDGIIQQEEWNSEAKVYGGDVFGIVDNKNYPTSVVLYFMHSTDFLFIGCNAEFPKEVRIYVEENGNEKWEEGEGCYIITTEGIEFYDMYLFKTYAMDKTLAKLSERGCEVQLPMGKEKWEVVGNEEVKMFVQVKNGDEYIGWWPQIVEENGWLIPTRYGKIILTEMGVEEVKKKGEVKLEIIPNPIITEGTIIITPERRGEVRIYNIVGRRVDRFDLSKEWKLKSKKYGKGVYYLIYKYENITIREKFLILK